MPAQDGTGPNGQGPLTGGGFGPCGTSEDRTVCRTYFGRRFFRRGGRQPFGRGRGFGRGNGFFAGGGFVDEMPTKEEEVSFLKSQASRLETALKGIQTQINNLESND
jgi:hypothetical protein